VFRAISDFRKSWEYESEATLKVLRALTEPALDQSVTPEGRSLGRLAWHIVGTLGEMSSQAGVTDVGPTDEAPQPALAEMIRQYEVSSKRLVEAIAKNWTDATLAESIPMYGEQWPRGQVLSALIFHQIHHRGQMTVLMRQAGLRVPGVYGPAREEWAAMQMPAPA
jgi:uncharacterized damage-inducible protein DinB